MIVEIIENLKHAAEKHKAVKQFYYGDERAQGFGAESVPVVYVESPVYFKRENNVLLYQIDMKVLLKVTDHVDIVHSQELQRKIGIEIIEYNNRHFYTNNPISDYDCYTLYYDTDNGLYGVRFSISIIRPIGINICIVDDNFDPNKLFEKNNLFPDINIVQDKKFPVFDLK